ncbi:hypothetical protein C8Q74DRAFT_1275571 [Fomes fomentarius]|nr:hypothetical protein C8Q74DRAFT_1275571 [Fomes fomentarius]
MSTHTETTLASLLPTSSFLLAYTLPVFLLSILLTFAGAFLTLDRTRAFAPRYDALKPREATKLQHAEVLLKSIFRFEGGIGGTALGFVTGVHLTTFLALLIPNLTTTKSLTPGAFLAICLLSAVLCSILAARWRYATLFFAGLLGYSTFALAFAVILHPSLLPRLILIAIFTPIGLIMSLLPIPRTQHIFVRLAMASVGAFGTVHSIALLAHIPAWTEVWDRLWIKDGTNWGTGKEKALSALFVLFVLAGTATDFFFKKKLGENPDEKWDSYLADYAATLPNASDRAGQFKPLKSFWGRHFGRNRGLDPLGQDIVFPTDADLKLSIPESPLKLYKKRSLAGPHSMSNEQPRRFTPPQEYLRKDRRPGFKIRQRTREVIKFDPLDPYAAASDSDDEEDLKKGVPAFVRSPTRTDSMATLADEQPAKLDLKKGKDGPVSEDEQDVTTSRTPAAKWQPEFFQRHHLVHKASSVAVSQAGTGSSTTLTPATFMSVPATPSLIKAVERVSAAQQEALSTAPTTEGLPPSSSSHSNPAAVVIEPHGHNWDAFWHDVKFKAGHGFQPQLPRRDGAGSVSGSGSGAAILKR